MHRFLQLGGNCGEAELRLCLGFLLFNSATTVTVTITITVTVTVTLFQNFAGISPEFARLSNRSTLAKGIITTRPSLRVDIDSNSGKQSDTFILIRSNTDGNTDNTTDTDTSDTNQTETDTP